MSCNDSYFHASTSRANGPTTMPRQQSRRPGAFFASVEGQRAEQRAESIRGGCLCPGGSVWVPACGGSCSYDDDTEKAQRGPPTSQLRSSYLSQQRSAPAPSSEAQQRSSKQKVQFSPAPSPAPSPPPLAPSPHLHVQPPMLQSTHSLSGRTAISGRTAVSDHTAVDPESRCSSVKFPQSMWQRLRGRISSPRRPNEASGTQQNSSQRVHTYPIPFCDHLLKIEWK